MNSNKEEDKSRFRNCEKQFREKLFLASYDLMSLNISKRILFQLYIFFDFLFLTYYPLDQIYNKSKSALSTQNEKVKEILSMIMTYLNPADRLIDMLPYSTVKV